jgi:DNA-binding beta-propeller fold protein YncE
LQATSQFVVALAVAVGLAYGLWLSGRSVGQRFKQILYLVIFVVFSLLTIRFAWLSSFVNYDYVNEFLVYAHGAPDVKWMLDQVDDISRRTVGDKQIKVAYGGVIWPLEWYMREYPNRAFFGANPNREALDAPLVIISPDSEVSLDDVEPYLGDNYRRFNYRQVWWPIENYKDQNLLTIWHTFFVPASSSEFEGQNSEEAARANWDKVRANRRWLGDVLFYRRVNDQTFDQWPFRTNMYFFVRKDVLNDLWDYRTGPMTEVDLSVDPYAEVRLELPALRVWGSNGVGEGQFSNPRALAISPQGQLYVADSGNHRIQVFDQNGNFLKSWGGSEGPNPGQLTEPWGIAVNEAGQVYVSDTWNHRVQIFDEDGNYLGEFGAFADTQGQVGSAPGSFWGPRDILIDRQGNLYVSDTGNKRVQKFTPDGEFLGVWGGGGVIPGRFEEPVGLAMDSSGNIYVVDTWNQRIQKFDPDFNPLAEWPVVGWESQNVVNKPFIAIDAQDRVFISDPENYRLIVYSNNGELLGTFGQYGQDIESFRLPLDLAFGDDDTLFVVDSDNNRVMKFDYPD